MSETYKQINKIPDKRFRTGTRIEVLERVRGTNFKMKDFTVIENLEYKFMFAVVRTDNYGETIQLFNTQKQAEVFFSKVSKIK